jgi:hypothetical protein
MHLDLEDEKDVDTVLTSDDDKLLVECLLGEELALEENENKTWRGYNIVEGDILEPELADGNESGNETLLLEFRKAVQEGRRWAGHLWGSTTIPYCFAPGTSSGAKWAFNAAVQHIESLTCLRFSYLEAYSSSSCRSYPSITVTSSRPGCSSQLGLVSNQWWSIAHWWKSQPLSLGRGCEHKGVAAHEILHALGFAHEQGRWDRDHYITILWHNIQSGLSSQFWKKWGAYQNDPYDYDSVMHYPAMAFGQGRVTIQAPRTIGQRAGLSLQDTRMVNEAYCR